MRAWDLMTKLRVMSRYVKTNSPEVARCKRCAVCEGPWQGAPGSFASPFLCLQTMGVTGGKEFIQKLPLGERGKKYVQDDVVPPHEREKGGNKWGSRVVDQSRMLSAQSGTP